jgi:hypothetical protein
MNKKQLLSIALLLSVATSQVNAAAPVIAAADVIAVRRLPLPVSAVVLTVIVAPHN